MFELSLAFKYLIPRWRQLSVSIISLISVLVISLVVWLIIVFFSVTDGLEKNWIDKLVSLTAPIRITPTPAYYSSYYYQIDSLSSASDYNNKTIGEKLQASSADPYDASADETVPSDWSIPDLSSDGKLKDLVKEAFSAVESIKGEEKLLATDYEMTFSNVRLRLLRHAADAYTLRPQEKQTYISQSSYLNSFEPTNSALSRALLPIGMKDLSNLLQQLSLSSAGLHDFFANATVTHLKTPQHGWIIDQKLLPSKGDLRVVVVLKGDRPEKILIPKTVKGAAALKAELTEAGFETKLGRLTINKQLALQIDGEIPQPVNMLPLIAERDLLITAQLNDTSLQNAQSAADIRFRVSFNLQNTAFQGEVPYEGLEVGKAAVTTSFQTEPTQPPFWHYQIAQAGGSKPSSSKPSSSKPNNSKYGVLPTDFSGSESVLLAKSFRDSGVLVGDRGYLSYYSPTASSVQEQRVPIVVAGFYDPGIIPIGGKFITVSKSITSLIKSSHGYEDFPMGNGINVRFANLDHADKVKAELERAFKERGIDRFWKIETYREYDFTRDLIQQLQSERHLFTLIAVIIIIVACSNIISMLVILVNDKKLEIGILRAMGASAKSIGLIFGFCGTAMGVMGGLIGTTAAIATLSNLNSLIHAISALQGYDLFSTTFYGDTLPSEISTRAVTFVLGATVLVSLLAGLIPALKASMLRPTASMKGEE